jgi:uncharacterized protein with HEPN domain
MDNIKTWLSDIGESIDQINAFVPPEMDFDTFHNDLKTCRAVERNIEIIGEAMDRILKENPGILIADSRKIVNARNRIIHGYESVSPQIIWLIIQENLPVLRKEVAKLLTE